MLTHLQSACVVLIMLIGIIGIWTQNLRRPPTWTDDD